jgi:hypothetical protein
LRTVSAVRGQHDGSAAPGQGIRQDSATIMLLRCRSGYKASVSRARPKIGNPSDRARSSGPPGCATSTLCSPSPRPSGRRRCTVKRRSLGRPRMSRPGRDRSRLCGTDDSPCPVRMSSSPLQSGPVIPMCSATRQRTPRASCLRTPSHRGQTPVRTTTRPIRVCGVPGDRAAWIPPCRDQRTGPLANPASSAIPDESCAASRWSLSP